MEKNEFQDPLKNYFEPERIEKAPEGFTDKIMSRISVERSLAFAGKKAFGNYRVPLISGIVTLLLIVAAVLVPPDQTDTLFGSVLKVVGSFRLTLPEVGIFNGVGSSFPEWAIYGIISFSLIMIADRMLFGLFHKAGKH
jgi:hypothetical protein